MASCNVLDIPFRRSPPLSLSSAIINYISTRYDQHPDMFKSDLAAIDKLRTDAINVLEPHVSGIQKLGKYAAQLQWISRKFPIDIGVDFTWYLALGFNTQRAVTQNNIQFERANILFNMAALYSKLATSLPRSTDLGLKSACNYFTAAAGVLKYLKEEVMSELRSSPPGDMDTLTLESLEQIMLAQAQECFWEKAVTDGKKDAVISKLAAKVSDFYFKAEEHGVKSEAISSEWVHHISAKRQHFAAESQFRVACDCLDRARYGQEIARLTLALENVNAALKEARYLNKMVVKDLNNLKSILTKHLQRSERDNDNIFLQPVPPASTLAPIQHASMVESKVPKEVAAGISMLAEGEIYGAPLFTKLVPFAVHLAASIYVERRDRLVNSEIINELETLTGALRDLLRSLNLPGSLQAIEKPLGLPAGLVAHAEEVQQQDGVGRLIKSIEDIHKLKTNNHEMHQEAFDMLNKELEEDEKLRRKHGTDRWIRIPSNEAAAKLFQQAEEYAGFMKSADNSDKLVKDKVMEHEKILRILCGPTTELEKFVPNSSGIRMTPRMDREVQRLRQCLNETSRLESRRRRKMEALREKAKADDITSAILAEAARLEREQPMQKIEPAMFEPLFDTRLQRYQSDKHILAEEKEEQDDISQRVKDANTSFLALRKVDSSMREREVALQVLENAYVRYREIIGNLDIGRKFYNDLTKLITRFRDECKAFVYDRRLEAKQIESEINMAKVRLNNSVSQQAQDPQASAKPPQSSTLKRTSITTPISTRIAPQQFPSPGLWNGDHNTPIKFSSPPP